MNTSTTILATLPTIRGRLRAALALLSPKTGGEEGLTDTLDETGVDMEELMSTPDGTGVDVDGIVSTLVEAGVDVDEVISMLDEVRVNMEGLKLTPDGAGVDVDEIVLMLVEFGVNVDGFMSTPGEVEVDVEELVATPGVVGSNVLDVNTKRLVEVGSGLTKNELLLLLIATIVDIVDTLPIGLIVILSAITGNVDVSDLLVLEGTEVSLLMMEGLLDEMPGLDVSEGVILLSELVVVDVSDGTVI